jgi:ribosomal protein S18 acetylase RimI-like enzyme
VSRAIRRYEPRDFDRIHRICVAAFTPVHEGFEKALGAEMFAREYPDWQARYADDIHRLVEDHDTQVHVVEDVGTLVGFVTTRIDAVRKVGELGLNAMDPAQQGKGIGKEMYAFALRNLEERGADYVYVGTGADSAHAPARAAYEAVGFDRSIPVVYYYRKL